MVFNASINQGIDLIAQSEGRILRNSLEQALADPQAITCGAAAEYQKNLKEDPFFKDSSEDQRIATIAYALLWSIVQPVQEDFRKKIMDFIETDEVQAFAKDEVPHKTAIDTIRVQKFGEAQRKYLESTRQEFAQKLIPYVKEALSKPGSCSIL